MCIEVNQLQLFSNIDLVRFTVKYSLKDRLCIFVDLTRKGSALNIYLDSL